MATIVFGQPGNSTATADQWVSTGPAQVDGPDYEQSPAFTVLADGTYVVGWTEYHPQNGPGLLTPYTAMAQRYDAAGNKIGGEFELNETPVAWPTLRLEATANGGFVALWVDGNQDGLDMTGGSTVIAHIPPTMSHVARKFDANGHPVSAELALNPAVTESSPVALLREKLLAGGGTVVAWNQLNQPDAYAFQLLDANGSAVGAPVSFGHDPEADAVPGSYSTPIAMDVAPTPDGGFVAMYSVQRGSYSSSTHSSASYLQHFGANGVASGALTPVPDARAVAVLPGADILLAGFPGGQQIELTRIDSTGAVSSSATFALPGGGYANLGPSGANLTVLSDGGWLLSWEQNTPVPGQLMPLTQLYGERFDAQGRPVGAAHLVRTFGNGTEAYDVKATPDGGVEYVWGDFNAAAPAGTDYLDVYMQHFGPASPAPAPNASAPVATDFFPGSGTNTLPPDWNIGITFNEAVKAGSGTITLETAAGQVVQTFAPGDAGIQFIGSALVVDPAADLQPGTTYKLIVAPDAVEDLAGDPYAGVSGYSFTTAGSAPAPNTDITAPSAIDFFPASGSNTLPPDWNIGITFNEAVKAGSGAITLQTAAGAVIQTFASGDSGIQVIGSSLVINPAADLQPGTAYRLIVATDAVEDLAGNAYAGESGYDFTTAGTAPAPNADTTAPAAIDFFPAPGSNTLPPDWNIGITFNEAVKAGSGAITLETAAGGVVQTFAAGDATIQFIGSSLIVNPAADLQPGTTYKLVVAPDAVEDLAGNAYVSEIDYTFTAGLVGVYPA